MYKQFRALWNEFFVEDRHIKVGNDILTWPNIVTTMGIVGTGIYVYQFTTQSYAWFIPITVSIIGLSDLLDGFLARRLDQHSRLGKFIDPLRDKILALAVLVNLLYAKDVMLFIIPLLLAVVCELCILVQDVRGFTKKNVSRVHTIGKMRQAVTLVCMGIFLLQEYWFGMEFISIVALVWVIAFASVANFILTQVMSKK
ncbi:MAG: CDP-diacylglycerol--glycerol-3-phosphate 3-phosphatidyltransferase [Patescibacteria group bacterium]|nr:MAG: CDP-diacylglycerol--glycerol-3-phosphate 3-phosphatidyltransferase [Patescibacteria group bacterium]